MLRYIILFLLFITGQGLSSQPILSKEDAVQSAINNQRNLKAANLNVQQQEVLLKGSAGLDNPQIFAEATPYEPLIAGVQQTFSMPGVYRNRKALQKERIRLARLQLQGSQYELKREVRLNFLQLQYLSRQEQLLGYQDSIYQEIKTSAKRFFEAGQINKLEELQSTTQADRVRNEWIRVQNDLEAERELFRFYTGITDSVIVEPLSMEELLNRQDTVISNVQQEVLLQQVQIQQRQLDAERSELLPQVQAGISFPTTRDYIRPLGYQVGVSIPIWGRQNRSRIAAAKTSVEMARAQQHLEQQRLNANYAQTMAKYRRDRQSLEYYELVALPQARAIIETSRRLFQGGELNYIESLRNLQMAFDIFQEHIDTYRSYNENVIYIKYLNGTL